MDEILFYIERRGKVTGPVTDDDVRDALREGKLAEGARVRIAGSELWASPRAFLTLARSPGAGAAPLPSPPTAISFQLPGELAVLPQALRDLLLFWVAEPDHVFGPLSGDQLRRRVDAGHYRDASVMLVDGGTWYPAALLAAPCDASAVTAAESTRESSLPEPPRTPGGSAAPFPARALSPAHARERQITLGSPSPPPARELPPATLRGPGEHLAAAPRDGRPPPAAAHPQQRTAHSGKGHVDPRFSMDVERPSPEPISDSRRGLRAPTPSPDGFRLSPPLTQPGTVRCPVCLERIAAALAVCPECGEPTSVAPLSSSLHGGGSAPGSLPSIPDDIPGQSFLSMHWRPIVTLGAIVALVYSGIALRILAPGRTPPLHPPPPRAAVAPPPAPACSSPCWNGEACQAGRCVWQPPNDVTHVAAQAEPAVSGPFPLPRDVSDAIPLDSERFAVALFAGLQIQDARTGLALGLVTDAPQSRRLYRVGAVLYATAPQRIFVVDAGTTRLLKTIETGATVGEVTLGASGRRALASLPSAHAVAVLATEYHAEIDRIQFGDDPVGPMGADDTGKRALTTTGQVPPPGFPQPQGGAVYAFDPSRLASAQDRVRASMLGNPVSVLMTPDGETSYVVLRAEDALVPLEWLPSGAVRQEARIHTCHLPEQIELVRRGRLGVVRCSEGRAIEVFDLVKRELFRHVPFNARVADLAVAPDGKQAIVALPAESDDGHPSTPGFVGLVDLETWAVRVLPLGAEPARVRLSPDGAMALVLSDRAKVAWVIR